MDLAAVERAYGELLAAFADLVVAETRGEPVDPSTSIATLRRRYRARRRRVGAGLAALEPAADADATGTATDATNAAEDRRAVSVMRRVLPWFDQSTIKLEVEDK